MEMMQAQALPPRTQYNEGDGHALKVQRAEELIPGPRWECAGGHLGERVSLGK